MTPVEQYDHTLLIATSVWVARALRCLDQAGLLDPVARDSIQGQLGLLAADAEAIPEGGGALDHLDMLKNILPAPPAE